jgi:hypothetical protein
MFPAGQVSHVVPSPQYPVLHVHTEASAVEPVGQAVVWVAWASQVLHATQVTPFPK